MSSLVKNILVFAALAALAYAGYYLFILNKDAGLETSSGSEGQLLTSEFLNRLNDIEQVALSRTVFDDARFRSLIDFSSAPQEVPAGRENPFQ
ncbi:hypothetical protein A2392_00425 [Candidatus Kaiserbacteria bacterium RIFOXYB1_FULL_46_14]|uniref:Uncharacterized protein n=1 Tax=Candidatus Kaiserbacteria bacterium RIFOXYB1_FULL_46_14 TaxID=1798531 RepID=A0A1F6FJ45_9BACT|nr:MAG: hypothetical protein A2392_00425 [Candidatus Kaiserbacteria bacterium RIFOXYB1_FULL_46_14]